MVVQEFFAPVRVAADGTASLAGRTGIGGFTPDADGTLTLTIGGTTMLSAMPVTAGVYYPLPYAIPPAGTSTVVLAGGASGCLAVI